MANPKNLDLTEDKVYWISSGIVYSVCCCPSHWTPEQVSDAATKASPPGTSLNRWEVAEPQERDDVFNGVSSLPCPDSPNRMHWLVNC
jgi:hypothetical protein